MTITRTLTDIPENEKDEVIRDFESEGAVTQFIDQGGGLWTVIATFDDEKQKPEIATNVQNADKAADTLARTIWGEARGESREGKEAVASVILNRLKKPTRFGGTIEEVCLKPSQFSCWNDNDPNLPKLKAVDVNDANFVECLSIAQAAVSGNLADSTIGADHYHTTTVSPDWSINKTPCITIGNHLFYNNIS
ncbi:cell wall hydrolase [Nitrosomonas sp.]|uniref:cell wall hydrolase n=1 Tax=Nitrosomonas sp. TaxID=42353 RepID=UPI0028442739|nr:cell wall hydrolase [Nitrosomonas sp.]MDR4515470.1 cell wall hydrolase [Nitrosomonas sp.]